MEFIIVALLLVGVVYFVIKMLGRKEETTEVIVAAPYKIDAPVTGDRVVITETVDAPAPAPKKAAPKKAAPKKPATKSTAKPAAKPATKKAAPKKPAAKKPVAKKSATK